MTQEEKTKLKRGTFQGVASRGFYNAFLEAAWVTLGIRVKHLAPACNKDELVFPSKMRKRFWAPLDGERRKWELIPGEWRRKHFPPHFLPFYPCLLHLYMIGFRFVFVCPVTEYSFRQPHLMLKRWDLLSPGQELGKQPLPRHDHSPLSKSRGKTVGLCSYIWGMLKK